MMHQYNRTFQKKKQENPAYHQGRKSSGVFNELQSRSISVAGDKKITNTIALQESVIMSIDSPSETECTQRIKHEPSIREFVFRQSMTLLDTSRVWGT
jgi:hypothetical protein